MRSCWGSLLHRNLACARRRTVTYDRRREPASAALDSPRSGEERSESIAVPLNAVLTHGDVPRKGNGNGIPTFGDLRGALRLPASVRLRDGRAADRERRSVSRAARIRD